MLKIKYNYSCFKIPHFQHPTQRTSDTGYRDEMRKPSHLLPHSLNCLQTTVRYTCKDKFEEVISSATFRVSKPGIHHYRCTLHVR
jgi:hypothetical protein